MVSWRFLTNHALVLVQIGQHPDSTGSEIAQTVGISERAVRKIVAELQAAGYSQTEKIGRRNRYRVDIHRPLQRVGEREFTAGELLAIVPVGRGVLAEKDAPSSAQQPADRTPPVALGTPGPTR